MSDQTSSRCQVCGGISRDGAYLCDYCMRDLKRTAGDMQSLLHEVSNLATGQTRVYRANRRTTDTPPTWDDEQNKIAAMLRSREGRTALPETRMMVNEYARNLLSDAYTGLLNIASWLGADEISSRNVTSWLVTNLTAARTYEYAYQVFDDLTNLHKKLERAVDRSASRLFAGPCHTVNDGIRCDRQLYAWPGADEIVCDGYLPGRASVEGCGAKHTAVDRQAFLIASIDDALLTLDVMLKAFPKLFPGLPNPPKTVAQAWVRQNRLIPHGVTMLGHETFRGGDMLALMRSYRPHTYAPRSRRSA